MLDYSAIFAAVVAAFCRMIDYTKLLLVPCEAFWDHSQSMLQVKVGQSNAGVAFSVV